MAPQRPYLKKSIVELEQLFEQNPKNSDILLQLLEELEHRSTKRAVSLKQRVAESLQAFISQKSFADDFPEKPSKKETDTHSTKQTNAQTETPTPPPSKPIFSQESTLINDAQNVLRAWTALEVLSPQSFKKPEDLVSGERNRIFRIQGKNLPWLSGQEKSRPNQRLYYQIILGSIAMEPAIASLLDVYADQRIERPQATGSAILATVMVDKSGFLVTEDGLAISSFAWGFLLLCQAICKIWVNGLNGKSPF